MEKATTDTSSQLGYAKEGLYVRCSFGKYMDSMDSRCSFGFVSHVINDDNIGIATLLCRVVLWLGEHIQFLLSHMIIGYPILFMSGRSGEPRNEFKNIVNIKPIYVTVF